MRTFVVAVFLWSSIASAQESTPEPLPTPTPAPANDAPPPSLAELARHTTVGGYAEAQAAWVRTGFDGRTRGNADLSRAVVALDSALAENVRAGFEFEWEHAIACAGCSGIAEVEQAWADVRLSRAAIVRSGLFVVPMGLVARRHEPTAFSGVLRPRVETEIIPSTWRELGVTLHGEIGEASEYEIGVVNALDISALSPGGLAGTRQHGNFARADAPALVLRFESEVLLGVAAGVSGYASNAGPNIDVARPNGERYQLEYPIYGASLDLRARFGPAIVRGVAVAFELPESEALQDARRPDGSPYFDPSLGALPTRMGGAYLELGYDFARHSLPVELFGRVERVDPQWEIAPGGPRRQDLRSTDGTLGLTLRPAPPLVFKADIQLIDRVRGLDETRFNLGMGLLY